MISSAVGNPLFKPLAILLVALSHSIGWGIRGDFGHESGAWIPGALTAIAVCVLSRREDWRARVGYCALFGGLGWGFGGSISYMYTMSFASSGQWQSVWYGYFAVCLVGGLWAGIGGAGTALPLCIDRDRLTRIFTPLCFVLAAMILNHFVFLPLSVFLKVEDSLGMDGTWHRQKGPLYWFDADWVPAVWALIGVCAYDLWDRRFAKGYQLIQYAVLGVLFGFLVQALLRLTGLDAVVTHWLVVPLGDLNAINSKTGQPFDRENLMTNWPQFFGDFPHHLGWWIGLAAGIGLYFRKYAEWRNDSKLFLYMASGWLLAFFAMPVLGTILLRDYGGFRLTPPRSDDWAGVTGVFVATCLYGMRHGMAPMAYAGALNFVMGGISFASMHLLRQMILIPSHPDIHWQTGGTPAAWKHFHSANWHSFLEQSQGFGFGVISALTMGLLWPKLKPVSDVPRVRRWTEWFSVGFVVFFMTYVNLFKNVAEWTRKEHRIVPEMMKAPLIEGIELSAATWFNIAWGAMALAFVALLIVHQRRRLDVVPASWLGKGQLIYVLLLWIMVIGDFERSLPNFGEQRLITEWVIIINASLATFLVVVLPGPALSMTILEEPDFRPLVRRVWLKGLTYVALTMSLYALVMFRIYGDARITGPQYRWGTEAVWRVKPILKNEAHR